MLSPATSTIGRQQASLTPPPPAAPAPAAAAAAAAVAAEAPPPLQIDYAHCCGYTYVVDKTAFLVQPDIFNHVLAYRACNVCTHS